MILVRIILALFSPTIEGFPTGGLPPLANKPIAPNNPPPGVPLEPNTEPNNAWLSATSRNLSATLLSKSPSVDVPFIKPAIPFFMSLPIVIDNWSNACFTFVALSANF